MRFDIVGVAVPQFYHNIVTSHCTLALLTFVFTSHSLTNRLLYMAVSGFDIDCMHTYNQEEPMTVTAMVNLARQERREEDFRIYIPDENNWCPLRSVSALHMQKRNVNLLC